MVQISNAVRQVNPLQILRCTEALGSIRPAALVVTGFVLAVLVAAACAATRSDLMVALGGLLALGIAGAGVSGAGVLLMDQARSIEPRSMMDAGVFGFMCLLRFIVLGLIFSAILLALALVAALVFFICKIPYLGPFLMAFAFPVFVVVFGFALFSFMAVIGPLSMPALWEGRGITEALAMVIAIARERLVYVIVSFIVLYLVCSIVFAIVWGIVTSGVIATGVVAAPIIGSDFSPTTLLAMGAAGALAGFNALQGSGHLVAVALSLSVLGAIVAALFAQVWIMGVNLVYLGVAGEVDAAGASALLESGLQGARRKVEEVNRAAHEAAERARQSAQARSAAAAAAPSAAPAQATATAAPQAAAQCPGCKAAIAPGDLFCGNCGYKLR
jgi:hypothetical protein